MDTLSFVYHVFLSITLLCGCITFAILSNVFYVYIEDKRGVTDLGKVLFYAMYLTCVLMIPTGLYCLWWS